MSTGYNNTAAARIAQLSRTGQSVFHTRDLANYWKITNMNTLYTTLKRYARQGLLYRIYKGMYSLLPLTQINPFLLGVKALHQYAYVSTETILAQEGFIAQHIPVITLISSQAKRFTINHQAYKSRQLKDEFLFSPAGIIQKNGVNYATVERAIADLLYFNPHAVIDRHHQVNWQKITILQEEIGYPILTVKRS